MHGWRVCFKNEHVSDNGNVAFVYKEDIYIACDRLCKYTFGVVISEIHC